MWVFVPTTGTRAVALSPIRGVRHRSSPGLSFFLSHHSCCRDDKYFTLSDIFTPMYSSIASRSFLIHDWKPCQTKTRPYQFLLHRYRAEDPHLFFCGCAACFSLVLCENGSLVDTGPPKATELGSTSRDTLPAWKRLWCVSRRSETVRSGSLAVPRLL